MPEILMRLSKLSAKIIHIPNYSKSSHYAMYFDAVFAAFFRESISTTRWQSLTMFLHLLHRLLQIVLFRFCGQVV